MSTKHSPASSSPNPAEDTPNTENENNTSFFSFLYNLYLQLLAHPAIQKLNQLIEALPIEQLYALIDELISKLEGIPVVNRILPALKNEVQNHPVTIAMILFGVFLALNPLAMLGFGSAGPIAGSIAASWQASIGAVQAGSAFAVLQSAGMTVVGTTLVPAAGVVMGVWGAVKRAFGAGHEEEGGK